MADIITRDSIIESMNAYTKTIDDDVIRFKTAIKNNLIKCPELLLALNWQKYESELFDEDGNYIEDGEQDAYFGTAILPYMIFPDTQTEARTYLCYTVHMEEQPRYNNMEYYYQVSFIVLSHAEDCVDKNTGLPRHDLIGSIIRERFNWTNIFGTQCRIVSNVERVTDSKFLTRTITLQGTMKNQNVITKNGNSLVVNYDFRR